MQVYNAYTMHRLILIIKQVVPQTSAQLELNDCMNASHVINGNGKHWTYPHPMGAKIFGPVGTLPPQHGNDLSIM